MHPCVRPGCAAVFERPYRLAAHLLAHDNKKGFKCKYENCGREYTSNSHLLRHFKSAHKPRDKTAEFKCPLCWCVYSNRQNLKRHFNVHLTTSALYACDVCSAQFSKKHILTAHMYSHTNVKGFGCEYCSRSFVTLRDKKRHLIFHKTYQCEECKELLQHWSEYLEHRKKHYREKEFICHHCERNFKVRTQIIRHLKLHDDNRQKKCFMCPVNKCSKFYTTKFNLQQHIRSTHEDRTFDCSVCEAKLATKARLKKHLETHAAIAIKEKIIKNKTERKARKDKGVLKKRVAVKIAGINLVSLWQQLAG